VDRSFWDSLIGMFEISSLHLKALLACWFIKGAFEVEEGRALSTRAFLRVVARFLWTTVLLYAAVGAAGISVRAHGQSIA
jgi:hypothetical protein